MIWPYYDYDYDYIAMLLIKASKMEDPTRLLAEVRGQLKDFKVSRVGRERADIYLKTKYVVEAGERLITEDKRECDGYVMYVEDLVIPRDRRH